MLMECPKCGFNQPKDQYCAKCGLDIEHFHVRPKPFFIRLWQNPSLYAVLVGGLLVFVMGYIFLNQRTISNRVGSLLHSHFVLSQNAHDPDEQATPYARPTPVADANNVNQPDAKENALPSEALVAGTKEPTYANMELGFFELSKETVFALNGKLIRDEGEWRVMYFEDNKMIESLRSSASKMPGGKEGSLQKDSVELDAGDENPNGQLPYLAVGIDWGKNETLHWAVDLQMPVTETATETERTTASESKSTASASALHLSTLEGTVPFRSQGALVLIYDPTQRQPAAQEISRLFMNSTMNSSTSPLKVFTSEDFRMGYSDLIIWIRLK
jgi:hypothetical protein